jgi:hypothetical protein
MMSVIILRESEICHLNSYEFVVLVTMLQKEIWNFKCELDTAI